MSTHSASNRTLDDAPDLMRVAKLALRWWPALLLAAALAAGAAAAAASRGEDVYESQVRVLVGPVDGEFNILRAAGQQAQTLSQLATSRPVMTATRRRLGREVAADKVVAESDDVTRVLTITVRDSSARDAARIANTVASELIGLIKGSGPRAGGRATRVIDPALPPEDPLATGLVPLIAVAGLSGLLAAIAVLLVVDYFRGRIATEAELSEVARLPNLGTVAAAGRGGALVFDADSESQAAAAYRVLAGRIALADPERPPRSLLVVGADRGDAGVEVVANLGAALAEGGARVVLVDADSAGGALSRLFALDGRPGLSELLADPPRGKRVRLAPELAVEQRPEMWVLPRGREEGHELLDPSRAARALAGLLERSDVVVVSGGSAGSAASALGWARLVEGCVVLATRTRTRRDAVSGAVDAFVQIGATVLGTVMVERRRGRRRAGAARPGGAAGRSGDDAHPLSELAPPGARSAPSPEGVGGQRS